MVGTAGTKRRCASSGSLHSSWQRKIHSSKLFIKKILSRCGSAFKESKNGANGKEWSRLARSGKATLQRGYLNSHLNDKSVPAI